MLLRNLTIIILTYNRYKYLYRLLNFYLKYELDFKIIILDSSSIEVDTKVIDLLKKNKEIKLIKFDSNFSIQKKIFHGMKNIKTKYCTLSADDDFLIPSSFKKCLNFLEKNKDYSSAHGMYFNYYLDTYMDNKIPTLFPLYDIKALSNDHNDPKSRLSMYFDNKISMYPFYAIHKYADLYDIVKQTHSNSDNVLIDEYLFSSLSLIKGKMKVFNDFYCAKNINDFNWVTLQKVNNYLSDYRVSKASKVLVNNLDLNSYTKVDSNYDFFKDFFKAENKRSKIKIAHFKHKLPVKNNYINYIKEFLKYINVYYFYLYINFFYRIIIQFFYYNIEYNDLKYIGDALVKYKADKNDVNNTRQTY